MKKNILLLFFVMVELTDVQCFIIKDTVNIFQVEVKSSIPLQMQGLNRTKMDSLTLIASVSGNLSDLLTRYSSIFIKSYGEGGLATASFRGTAASHTQVYWNGLPLNSPMLGSVDLSLLPVFFADDISLLYGSSSLVIGSGALGGSILIENRPDWENHINWALIQGIGSFRNYQTFLSGGGGSEKIQTNTRIIVESAQNNYPFYNDNTGNYMNQTNDNFSKTGLMQEFYYKTGTHDLLSLKAWGLNSNRNIPQLTTTDNSDNTYLENQKDKSLNAVFEWKHMLPKGNLDFSAGITASNLKYFQKYKNATQSILQDSSFYTSAIGFLKGNIITQLSSCFNLESGISLTRSIANAENFQYSTQSSNQLSDTNYSAGRTESSLYMRLNACFSESFHLFLLIRQGSDNNTLEPFIPSITIDYQAINHNILNIDLNIARNYHLPTLDDLYFIPGGNSALKPEEGYSCDLLLNQHFKTGDYNMDSRVSCYTSYIYNWIVWNYTSYNLWTPNNDKIVFARGIEFYLNSEMKFSQWKCGVKCNFSFTRTTSQDRNLIEGSSSFGKQLIFIPMYLYNLLYFCEYKHWYLNYSLNYTGNRFSSSDDDPESLLPRYLLNNIALGRTFSIFQWKSDLQFQVNNLFNTSYEPIRGMSMPGVNFELLFRIHFNKPI